MTANQMIEEYTAIFNACGSIAELYDVMSGIDWGKLDALTVAQITNAFELAEAAIKDHAEFDRIKAAKRGTVRIERGDYVIIAHCSTYETIEFTKLEHTTWYVSVNFEGDPIKRAEFNSDLTWQALDTYITAIVVQHSKGGK